jgi:hypothetical protein
LIEELGHLGVEQIVLVTAAPEPADPHALAPTRLDGRGRVGEYLQSQEAAQASDLALHGASLSARLYAIRPAHNPVGPLDFADPFDDGSERRVPLKELMALGYRDAYQQFIEPVLGASGEGLGRQSRRA